MEEYLKERIASAKGLNLESIITLLRVINDDGRRVRKSLGTKDRKLAELALKDFEVQLAKGKLGFVMDVPLSDFFRVLSQMVKSYQGKKNL